MQTSRVDIAVTSGDPAGVGPEIIARLFAERRPARSRAIIVGAPELFAPWRETFGLDCPVAKSVDALYGADPDFSAPVVILDTGVTDPCPIGTDSASGGKHAGRAIEIACDLVRNWSVAGIVTAPISKKSLNLGKFEFPGHTEMLARYLNAPDCQMMMVHKNLRVVPLTRHVSLRDVSAMITPERIATCVRTVVEALQGQFCIARPRIAVAGLNPHAGEDGTIGDEETTVIAPAIARLREDGMSVDGPFPADALFQSAARGADQPYDAYVAMYHDQGLVPFKMAAQRRGVNVTVGLPVIRTSVDHGTAFDIAGRGIAEAASIQEAYELAETLSERT